MTTDKDLSPSISVVIPAYNAARFIAAAVDSVLQQSYKNLEIIVVDDGSTDNTLDVLVPYRGQATILTQKNAGPSAARNRGFSVASGEYAFFLDSDDLILPEALRLLATHLTIHPECGLVAGEWNVIDASGNHVSSPCRGRTHGSLSEAELHQALLLETLFPPVSALIRSDELRKCAGWDESLWCAEDRDLWLRLARQRCRFDFLPLPVASYRRHPNNSTLNISRMEQHMLSFLEKWFGVTSGAETARASLRPYAYMFAWLFLAGQCQEAGLAAEMERCSRSACDWIPELEIDEKLIHRTLWEVYEKPWEPNFHSALWSKSKLAVAELCWVHGRESFRRHETAAAINWFLTLARKHPAYFMTKLRRLLAW